MEGKKIYCPFQHYSIARRSVLLPGQYYEPFSNKTMCPPVGAQYAFFDANRDPCENIGQAVYVVYNDVLNPPPGFEKISPGFPQLKEVAPINSLEQQQVIWQSSCQYLNSSTSDQMTGGEGESNRGSPYLMEVSLARDMRLDALQEQEDMEESYQLQTGTEGYYLKPLKRVNAKIVTNYTQQLQEVRH